MSFKGGKKKGQSLIEILVAVGVGTIMLLGAITALSPAIKSQTDVNRSQVGAALGAELLDEVRVFAEASWHNIDSLSTGSSTKYYLNAATSTFRVATGTESVPGDLTVSGLIGYWKMDEATGTVIGDFSGSRNNGTTTGTYATSGFAGNARFFNGTSDYVGINYDLARGTTTVSFWVNTISSNRGILQWSNTSYNYQGYTDRVFYVNVAGSIKLYVYSGGTCSAPVNFLDGTTMVNDGRWHNVVGEWSPSNKKLYIDGVLQRSTSTGIGAAGAMPYFSIGFGYAGSCYNPTSGYLPGKIDDVRLYSKMLSDSEVQSIYNANIFYRDFYLTGVYRNGSGFITESGTLDPSTRLLTVEYWWGSVTPKIMRTYLTRYQNNATLQTDWAGGAGVDGPASSTLGNKFATSSNIDNSTTTGSLRILGL